MTSSSCEPRKIDMIAGGASLAPEAVVLAGVGDARAEQVGVDVDARG